MPEVRSDDVFKGEINEEMQIDLISLIRYALFSITSISIFVLINLLGLSLPFFATVLLNTVFAGSTVHLIGVGYGIMNDIIGCKKCLPYFFLGHQPGQRSIIESNDTYSVAIAWGIFATNQIPIVAGGIFAGATFIMGLAGLPFMGLVFPIMACLTPLGLYAANSYANKMEHEREKAKDFNLPYVNNYVNERLEKWLTTNEEKNKWLGNSDRNLYGYLVMPLIGLASLVSFITLTLMHSYLPTILLTAAFASFPPAALGFVLVAGIGSAITYLAVNHQKQVDNKYKMDFSKQPKLDFAEENNFQDTHSRTRQALNIPNNVVTFMPEGPSQQNNNENQSTVVTFPKRTDSEEPNQTTDSGPSFNGRFN